MWGRRKKKIIKKERNSENGSGCSQLTRVPRVKIFRHSLRLFWLKESDPPTHSTALFLHEAAGMRHLYNIRPLKAVTFSYFPSSFHSPFNRETSVSEPVTPLLRANGWKKGQPFLREDKRSRPCRKVTSSPLKGAEIKKPGGLKALRYR